MQDLNIRFKGKIERRTDQFMKGYTSSGYKCLENTIALVYWKKLEEDLALKVLIGDIDHETTHHILKELIDLNTSERFDSTTIQKYLAVGLKDSNEYDLIIDLVKKPPQVLNRRTHI